MCGVAGFIDFKKKSSRLTLQEMTDVLHHRGPDDSGYEFIQKECSCIGLGHRRLSILDLSKHGHQPMVFEDIVIVYNGEVYNFLEIREELEKFGYIFKSDSDTEVILKAYHKWGIKSVEKFNGMFAICIYDKRTEKLILIRDRAGVKPFFWYWSDDLFLFSSELKSFHAHPNFKKKINKKSLALYFEYGYILQPHTIFDSAFKLRSGHYLEIDLKKKSIKEEKYWSVIDSYNREKLDITESEAIVELEKILKSSFDYRMVSDVPVGVFLSGGYDSSAVAAILQKNRNKKIKTFTIGFHEKGFDEAQYAKQIAQYLGTDHTEYYCTQKEALGIIPLLPDIYDEPFGDASAIPTILVSQMAKKEVSVALSADGGDEVFAGYGKYLRSLKYLKFLKYDPLVQALLKKALSVAVRSGLLESNKSKKLQRIINILNKNDNESILKFMKASESSSIHTLVGIKENNIMTFFDATDELSLKNDDIAKMLAIDYMTYMVDDVLVKVDRATMSVGLEGREPLLDYRIIEFAARLPSQMKFNNGVTKDIFKKIVHKYIPKNLMDRPKMGFGVPLHIWFQDELEEIIESYLNRERIIKEGVLDAMEVERIKQAYYNDKTNEQNFLSIWLLLMFEMWYEKWM